MAGTTGNVKISEQIQAGVFKCYKKFIGGRVFYLTQERGESERLAVALLGAWERIRSGGGNQWNDGAIAADGSSAILCQVHPKSAPHRFPIAS